MSAVTTTPLVELDPRVDPRWRDLVATGGGSLFHSPEWLSALASAYDWSPRATVVCDEAGAPVAGIPWCLVADAGGERVVSLPFSDVAGPVGTGHVDALLAAVEAMGLPVRCRVVADPGDVAPRAVVGKARWQGIRLGPDAAEAWERVTPSTQRAVRKARREGVTIEARRDAELVPRFLRLHTGVRKRKYRLLPQPRSFFDALRQSFAAVDSWHPLVAMHDGEIVAVTVYLRSGDALYYKFNASDPDALGIRPNDLLLWAGIELAIDLGCRTLDLGASDDDQPGLIRFKRGFGAQEREIRRLASGPPLPEAHARLHGALGRLTTHLTDPSVPDALTEAAGDAFYRYFV